MRLVVFIAICFGRIVLEQSKQAYEDLKQIRQERVELIAKCCELEDLNRKLNVLSWKLYIDLGNVDANSKCMGGDSDL